MRNQPFLHFVVSSHDATTPSLNLIATFALSDSPTFDDDDLVFVLSEPESALLLDHTICLN